MAVVVVDKFISTSSFLFNQTPASAPAVNKLYYNYSPSNNNNNNNNISLRCFISNSTTSDDNQRRSICSSAAQSNNYVVSFDSSSCITRPLAEILRDLNKRIPDSIIIKSPSVPNTATTNDQQDIAVAAAVDQDLSKTYIPWYHANRMLSFYAPGWCGEIRDVIFSDNGSVTVVYRVTIRGSDGEAHRESSGTVSPPMNGNVDAVAAAEEIAFCRACARFGLGLYLYHDE